MKFRIFQHKHIKIVNKYTTMATPKPQRDVLSLAKNNNAYISIKIATKQNEYNYTSRYVMFEITASKREKKCHNDIFDEIEYKNFTQFVQEKGLD